MSDFDPNAGRSKTAMVLAIVLGGLASALLFWAITGARGSRGKDGIPDWIPKKPPPVPMASLRVLSKPEGAKVFLDPGGVALAKTPGVLSVTPKPQTLRFELPGLPVKRLEIDAASQEEASVEWDAVTVSLDARAEGDVTLYLDGKALGYAPYKLYFPREAKTHEIKAMNNGQERLFVFQTQQDISRTFDFTKAAPSSAPTSGPASAPAPR